MTLIAIKHIFGERWKWFLDEESCFETLVALRQVFGASEQVAYNIALLFPESYRPRVIKRWRARGELDPHKFVHDVEMRFGQAALGKVVANYVKYGSMRNAHHIVLPYLDQHYGNGLITVDLLAQVDPKMAMRAVGSMYLSRMMGGPDGNREATLDLNVENYIASIPMLYVACSDFTYTNTETCVRYCAQLAKVDHKDIKKLIDSIYAILALRSHTAERLLSQCPFYVFALWAADYVEDAHPVDVERSWGKPELRSALDMLSRNGREFA